MFFQILKQKPATAAKPSTTANPATAVETIQAESVHSDYDRLLQALEAFVDAQGHVIESLVKGEEAA